MHYSLKNAKYSHSKVSLWCSSIIYYIEPTKVPVIFFVSYLFMERFSHVSYHSLRRFATSGTSNASVMHCLIVKQYFLELETQGPNLEHSFQMMCFSEQHCLLSLHLSFRMGEIIAAFFILLQADDLGSDVCKRSSSLQSAMGQGLGDRATSVLVRSSRRRSAGDIRSQSLCPLCFFGRNNKSGWRGWQNILKNVNTHI